MFDSRRLLKIIEREEKTGITLVFDDLKMHMLTEGWLAGTTRDHLMTDYREVLGHIVEVLGYIPDREIVSILKSRGVYVIQHPLPETVSESMAFFMRREREEPVQFTGLHYGGSLFQTADGVILRCAVTGPNPGGKPVLTDRERIVFRDVSNSEAAWYTTFRPREDISSERDLELWRHLESVLWNEWEKEPETEIDGQTTMEGTIC